MRLAPLLEASPVIQLHSAAAMAMIVLGVVQFAATKGTSLHKWLGYGWAGGMLLVALTSFGIRANPVLFGLSWIHLLSMLVLVTVPHAVYLARIGRIKAHQRAMVTIFIAALVVTGTFTLAPGRIFSRVVFGG